MQLVHTQTLKLNEVWDDDVPYYAILSHTWEKSQEVSHREMINLTLEVKKKTGYDKIKKCAVLAKRQEYDRVWIDTCCTIQVEKSLPKSCLDNLATMMSHQAELSMPTNL
jgi:hypothetical protein